MSDSGYSRILSAQDASGLIGRERELGILAGHAGSFPGSALLVLSAPGTGASEVLRQSYDRIFNAGGNIVPVYFEFRASDGSSRVAAERFLREFLNQLIAFKRGEPRIIGSYPDVCEIEDLAPAADRDWIGQLVRACGIESGINNDTSFVPRAFGAPLRASVQGVRCFVIIDGVERASLLEGGETLVETLAGILSGGDCPYVLAGKRKFIERSLNQGALRLNSPKKLEIEPLPFEQAGRLVELFSIRTGIAVTEQSRDLIITMLGPRPVFVRALFDSASEMGLDLRSFRDVVRAYADSLFGGRIGGYFDALIDGSTSGSERRSLIELFHSQLFEARRINDPGIWRRSLGDGAERGADPLAVLAANELVDLKVGGITASEDTVLADLIEARYRMEIRGQALENVLSKSLGSFLKRATGTMAQFYRSVNATGIGKTLRMFDCQEIPLALMDYRIFNDSYKGESAEKLVSEMRADIEKVKLPQVFHAESASAFYTPIAELIEDDRATIAFGFEHAEYDDDNEVVWLAAEIDSKLEAREELTSFWCDRLEMVAAANDFTRFRIWLVAPEGFSPAALEVLHERHAIGSSRAQAKLLAAYLRTGDIESETAVPDGFEIVVPMGEDTELIAAHAIEDIARRKGFAAKQINQIKTALVEACINASEHSLSPDRKIRIEVSGDDTSLVLTVSNRGLRFSPDKKETVRNEERRGWGIRLIRTLMDEVSFEHVDDGTRIRMVKNR
jgi:serine/threonine-protein kinase RsbW